MRLDERDRAALADMVFYARAAVEIAAHRTYTDYLGNLEFQLAVERAVELVGEAARRLSQELRDALPGLPWSKIISQRNVLAHEYGDVDPTLIWVLLEKELPALLVRLEGILAGGPDLPG
jgi:uncharacterized protein with HEPN domain